jgi:heme-degrading monooxygenase HmoA
LRRRADRLLATEQELVAMHARTSSWSGSSDALESWGEHVSAHVAPFVAGLPGNAGCVFLIDREGRSGLTLTLWESEEAALASDRNAEQSRASTVAATGVELVERGRYEVVARV